jgi:hypothetical protein
LHSRNALAGIICFLTTGEKISLRKGDEILGRNALAGIICFLTGMRKRFSPIGRKTVS